MHYTDIYTVLESIDELNRRLESQYRMSRMKGMEIEDLKVIIREKDEKMSGKRTISLSLTVPCIRV